MASKKKDLVMQDKVFGYLAAGTALILSIPLIAMQFTNEVDWGLDDFVIMGTLLFGMGTVFIFISRATPRKYRIFVATAVVAATLIVWIHLAVGLVDTWPLAGS